jgi:plasmid replication initiation protein
MEYRMGKKKNLVVVSNSLIESRYKLPVMVQKVLIGCAMKVRSTDNFGETLYTLSVDDYSELFGISSNATYENLRDAIDVLWNSSFYTVSADGVPVENRWIISRKKDKRKNYIGVKFHSDIKDFIYQLTQQFTMFSVENVAHLRSQYSIRLFQLLKQYEKIGWRKLDYQELRLILSIGDNEYKLYGDFNRRVLKQAQKEIRENTDITFTYKQLKEGKKVKGIHFIIDKQQIKREPQLPGIEDKHFNEQELYDSLVKFGCSGKEADIYISKLPKEYILNNLKYCIEKHKEGTIKSKRSYLKSALERDFAYNSDVVEDVEVDNKNIVSEKLKLYKSHKATEADIKIIDKYYKELGRPNWKEFILQDPLH